MYRILVINPGSTSTELSIFEDEKEVKSARIVHPVDELRKFGRAIEQFPYRNKIVKSTVSDWRIKKGDLSAVIGRSGPPTREGGTFEVNQKMVDDVKSGKVRVEHPAILGCLLAKEIADEHGIPAFVPHPSPIEWPPIAGVSGIPIIERKAVYHRQNIEAVARLAAKDLNKDIGSVNLVIAHLEGGMSIIAFESGRAIDTTSAFDEGPFTMERSGSLPCVPLVELCFSGKYTREQILKMIRGEGGMVGYLGINKVSEVEDRIDKGDDKARFYLEAMCYQIAKDIGAMATVLKGRVDAVVLTGKILDSRRATDLVKERVKFIAPVKTYPEQEALVFAQAALRILKGEEYIKKYG
ncbi:butyrate kinase [Chloroflexota bacterium]